MGLAAICLVTLIGSADRTAFEEALVQVDELLQAEEWSAAQTLVLAIAREHSSEPYALAARPGLLRDLRRAAYFAGRTELGFEQFWDVDALDWRPRSSRVRATYAKDARSSDFEVERFGKLDLLQHFAPFASELEIEVRGPAYPAAGLSVYLGLGGPAPHRIDFGQAGSAGQIDALARGTTIARASDAQSLRPGKKYRLQLTLRAGSLEVRANGKRWFDVAVEPCPGRFGFAPEVRPESIEIDGTVDATWVRAVLESARQHRWDEFQDRYDAEAKLPPALRATSLPSFGALPYPELAPGPDRPGQAEITADIIQLIEIGEGDGAVDWLRKLAPGSTAPVFRTWLLALAHMGAGRLEVARAYLDDVIRAEPSYSSALLFRGLVYARLERWDACVRDLDVGLQTSGAANGLTRAQVGFALHQVALAELQCGRLGRARERIEEAIAAGLYGRELDQVNGLLAKAQRGPSWERSFEETTAHYRVRSNVDRRSCIETARVLEVALDRFSKAIRPVEVRAGREFQVFLFSDEAGYQGYIADLFGQRRENTAGLYTPALGQLLIRDLPDAAMTERTIRHEGFHQYFDLVCDDPPVWLNEGLAEYWESADFTKSSARMIAINRTHLNAIPSIALTLRELFELTPAEFYGYGSATYALSWGIVYYLQHANERTRARFQELIDRLAAGEGFDEAVPALFPDEELELLERDYRAYLATL